MSRSLDGPPAVAAIEDRALAVGAPRNSSRQAQSSPLRTRRAVQCQGRSADLVRGTSSTSNQRDLRNRVLHKTSARKAPSRCQERSAYLQAPTCYRIEKTMDQTKLEEQIAGLAALSDPTRRRLYFFVASRLEGAGREEAAEAVGITRALAAFHLDRLVEDELLVVEYRRLTGRSGPGAGRPAKIYRRSTRQLAISLPQRNYELLARLLAQAMMGGEGASSSAALADAAHELGTNLGIQARRQAGARAGRDRLLAEAAAVLNDCGFEAAREDACLCLRNCPSAPSRRVHGGRLRDEPVPHAGGDLRPPGQRDGGGPSPQSRAVLRRVPAHVSCVSLLNRTASLSQVYACLRSRRPLHWGRYSWILRAREEGGDERISRNGSHSRGQVALQVPALSGGPGVFAPGLPDPAFHLQQGEYLFPALTNGASPSARPQEWRAEDRCGDVAGFEILRRA